VHARADAAEHDEQRCGVSDEQVLRHVLPEAPRERRKLRREEGRDAYRNDDPM
jgi:hypothetical protein